MTCVRFWRQFLKLAIAIGNAHCINKQNSAAHWTLCNGNKYMEFSEGVHHSKNKLAVSNISWINSIYNFRIIVPAACNHRRGVSIDCQQLGCIAPARLDDWVAAKRRTQEEKGAPSPVTEFRRSIPVTTHVIYTYIYTTIKCHVWNRCKSVPILNRSFRKITRNRCRAD